uniref:Uncharacterized protein n=1 Tax=Rhizophora mucronata TaxID=61149 RepID=A0A2P2QSL2_RHIMU
MFHKTCNNTCHLTRSIVHLIAVITAITS